MNFYMASGFKEKIAEIVQERAAHNISERNVSFDMDYVDDEGFVVTISYYYRPDPFAPDYWKPVYLLDRVNMSEFAAWLGE